MAKGIYVGVEETTPIYNETVETANIIADNISSYFTVTNNSYYFAGSGSTFTSNNGGVDNSTAQTTLEALQDISNISFNYSYSSESSYDKFTLVFAGTTVENAVSGSTTNKSYSGALSKGQTIIFTYSKDGSKNSNEDKCTFSNMNLTIVTRTQIGSETKSIARKVKKAYTGIDNKARKIKKGYIGVGGVARPFYSAEQKLVYYGSAPDLWTSRGMLAATTVGDYALFGGGGYSTTFRSTVDAYTSKLVKSTATDLSRARYRLEATTVGDYALFAGGTTTTTGGSESSDVDSYTSALVKGTPSGLSYGVIGHAAASVGDFALFAGGYGGEYTAKVNVYTSALAKGTLTDLSKARSALAATTVGNYVIFAGGGYSAGGTVYVAIADTYTIGEVVKGTATDLSQARASLAATTVGDYALFAGGNNSSTVLATVDTYTSALVKGTAANLSSARNYIAATTVGDFAIFAGGSNKTNGTGSTTIVDTYTSALVKGTATALPSARTQFAATSTGDYALFGGGYGGYTTVFAYQVVE